jgi:hypothetical protein
MCAAESSVFDTAPLTIKTLLDFCRESRFDA